MGGDHKCPVCQATFTRPQHVARHMRSHTGDRPYKCQFCGDQFARSDLLSRHVNKCHASEKPLPSTGSTRRKGSASASRATTSKQACDQCVQSSLPCDGSNPCSKCVQRKCRCTYVKFHRQTAPAGPGHHSARPAGSSAVDPSSMSISAMPMSGAVAVSSGLGGIGSSIPLSSGASSSRIPLYHPAMRADDDFMLIPPPPPGPSSSHPHHGHTAPSTTRGNNGVPTMAETLYGSNSFDFPALYPPTAGTGTAGSVGSTSSDGGDVDSDYAAAKYRAQAHAELYGTGRTTGGLGYDPRPSSSSAASSGNNNPHTWLGWDQHPHSHQNQHHQQIRPDAFPQQHPHQQQHSGSQRITSQPPVDLSGSGGVEGGLGGGGGGGGLGIGANVGSSLHDNPSQFMHSSRRPRGAPITQSQVHGQTPPPPPHNQRVDVHEGLDLQLGGMGSPTHPHGRGHALSMVGGMDMGASADMDGMGGLAMSMPMPMSSAAALGMNLGVVGFVDVGTGAGGASGEEEDVGVGMMLGVYHPKHHTGRPSSASTTASSKSSRSSRHEHGHQQQHSDDSDDMKEQYHVGTTDDERWKERQEFNNAFGLMSLEDPNMGGGVEPGGGSFFSDPAQAHNRDRAGSGPTRTTTTSSMAESRGRPHTTSNTHTNTADMDTPMPMKRISGGLLQFSGAAQLSTPSREGDTKELREFWRAYMHTPLSDAGGGESGRDSNKATPLAPGGYRKRVASLPSSKTPIVERDMGDMGMMYGGGEVYPMRHGGGGAVQHHGSDHREDLRSYGAAVMARKAPTTLNLRPRMARGRGDNASHGTASAQKPHSSLANPPFGGPNDALHVPVNIKHEGSTSPSLPSSSPRSSSCVVEDASDTTDSQRPSFKRLPSQTLGPNNAKRAYLGRGVGASSAMGGMGMGMGGFEGSTAVDHGGGDDRYNNPHTQESAAAVGLGMTGLSHPDRVVKSLGERRRKMRRMSAPTSGSGVVGLGIVEVGGREETMEK